MIGLVIGPVALLLWRLVVVLGRRGRRGRNALAEPAPTVAFVYDNACSWARDPITGQRDRGGF